MMYSYAEFEFLLTVDCSHYDYIDGKELKVPDCVHNCEGACNCSYYNTNVYKCGIDYAPGKTLCTCCSAFAYDL